MKTELSAASTSADLAVEGEEGNQWALSIVGRFPAEPDSAQRHDDYFAQEP